MLRNIILDKSDRLLVGRLFKNTDNKQTQAYSSGLPHCSLLYQPLQLCKFRIKRGRVLSASELKQHVQPFHIPPLNM